MHGPAGTARLTQPPSIERVHRIDRDDFVAIGPISSARMALQHARRSQSYGRRATSVVVCSAVLFSCSDAESPTDAANTAKLDEMTSVSGYLLPKAEKTISNGQEVATIGFEHDEVADDASFG